MTIEPLLQFRPGEVRRVTSAANEVVKAIRALELKKHRAASGLFVAEGARTVIEALERDAGIVALAYLAAAAAEPRIAALADAVADRGGLVLEVSREVLEKISRRDNPQTVIGVFRQRWGDLSMVSPRGDARLVALEQVRDPGNLGTILRTADGFGVKTIVLIGECTDPYALDAVRASMGSIFAVDLVEATLDAFLGWKKDNGLWAVGTHLEGAIPLQKVAWRAPSVIVMGNEQQGLSALLAKACDALVKIPMRPGADSFNLAIATAITLWDSLR